VDETDIEEDIDTTESEDQGFTNEEPEEETDPVVKDAVQGNYLLM
jgi:hypothetical protein